MIGVDHARTGKADYTSLAIYDTTRLVGMSAVADTALAGSARAWLGPQDPDAASLYAWRFARDCAGATACTVVPTTFPGAPLDATLSATERPYLEPATRTGPDPSELLPPRVLRLVPR